MISRRYRSVFVHVPKTAGQSIETVLLRAEGLTWDKRASTLLRPNSDPAKGPERLAHLYASEYVPCGHLSQAEFDGCYKFAVVRDPYAWALSEYRYRYAETGMTVDAFLALSFDSDFSNDARHVVPQSRYVVDARGAVIVDKVIRFETLDADLAVVWRKLFGRDVPKVHWKLRFGPRALLGRVQGAGTGLPHRNRTAGDGPRRAADLTAAQRAIIEARYAEDFRLFDYPIYRA